MEDMNNGTEAKYRTTIKACDPDGVPVEAIRLLMQYGEDLVLQTTNEVVINGMPDMWRSTIITPIFKGKEVP